MALSDSLLNYWTMDESGSVSRANSVGAGTSLAVTGTITSAAGIVGAASASFPGTNGNILSMSDEASISAGATDFFLNCWLYPADVATLQIVYQKGEGGNFEYSLTLRSDATVRFSVFDNALNETVATSTTTLTANTWAMITCYHLNGNKIGVAVNAGTPVEQSFVAGVNDSTGDFRVGNRQSNDFPYNGRLDELGFWRRAWTASDSTLLYNGGLGLAYPFTPAPEIAMPVDMAFGLPPVKLAAGFPVKIARVR